MGCRLLSLIEGVDLNPLDRDLQGTQANCDRSKKRVCGDKNQRMIIRYILRLFPGCESSYVKENDSKACKSGCALQVPISLQRRKEVCQQQKSRLCNCFMLFGLVTRWPLIPSAPSLAPRVSLETFLAARSLVAKSKRRGVTVISQSQA